MISVVIPYYENNIEKRPVLKECTDSLKGHDEVVVVWNDRKGYAPSINLGLANARGDFIVVMNDDVKLVEGSLDMLCDEEAVTSPTFMGRKYPYIWGSCFCLPRWVYEKIGGMDERYDTSYYDDDHLICNLLENDIPMKTVESVVFDHKHPGLTLESLPDRDEFYESNKKKFIDYWGALPNDLYRHYELYGRLPYRDNQ